MKVFFSTLAEPVGAIWLLLVCLCLLLLWRRQWRNAAWVGLPVGLLFLFGSLPVIDRLVWEAEWPYIVSDLSHLPEADAVVALGGGSGVVPPGPLNFSLSGGGVNRYLTAVLLTRLGKAPVLVLGGAPEAPDSPGQSQMIAVQNWIRAWALTSVIVTNLGICDTTHDEALHYAELAAQKRWTRILLVTSALHLPRAVAVFRHQGVTVVPVGCDFQTYGYSPMRSLFPSQRRFELWALYLHEKVGWLVYRWRGWI